MDFKQGSDCWFTFLMITQATVWKDYKTIKDNHNT